RQTCLVDDFSHVYCRGTDVSGTRSDLRQIDVAGAPDTRMPGSDTQVIDELGRVFELTSWQAPEQLKAVGDHNAWVGIGSRAECVLKRSGSLWCTDTIAVDKPLLRAVLPLGEDVVAAGVGDGFFCALLADGRVYCDSRNPSVQFPSDNVAGSGNGAFAPGLER